MVSSRSVQNVLRIVRAGKEEVFPASPAPAAPATTAPAPGAPPAAAPAAPEAPKGAGTIVSRARYYFFDAPAGNKIPFKDIDGILKSNNEAAKSALIENLKGGNSGKFCADYFRWLKIVVAADMENGTRFVYSCDLNPVGTKLVNKAEISPDNVGKSLEDAEKELMVFSTESKQNLSNVVSLEASGESKFVNGAPPPEIVKMLQNRQVPGIKMIGYDQFKELLDEFRIWVPDMKRLVLPNLENPGIEEGQYPGGPEAYNKFVAPVEQKLQQPKEKPAPEKSLGEKEEEKGPEIFQPAGPTKPTQGDVLDQPSGLPTTPQGVRMASQSKDAIHRVMLAYLKDAVYSTVPSQSMSHSNQTSTQGAPQVGGGTVELTMNPQKNKAKFEKANKAVQDANKAIQNANRGLGGLGSSSTSL
jgi:hypothetical protein